MSITDRDFDNGGVCSAAGVKLNKDWIVYLEFATHHLNWQAFQTLSLIGGKHVNLELPSATDLVKASCLKLTVEIVD